VSSNQNSSRLGRWRLDCRASGGGESRDQRDVFLCRDLFKSYRVHRLRKAETTVAGSIISVDGLPKRFLIAHNSGRQGHTRYTALRDVIGREFRNVARKTKHMLRGRRSFRVIDWRSSGHSRT
jgi:hypothetical protein